MTDEDGIAAIADLLAATRSFGKVLYNLAPTGPDPAAQETPWVWIHPKKWDCEKFEGDEIDQPRSRIVTFEIELYTAYLSTADQKTPAELATVIEQAVHGQVLAGASTSCVCQAGTYTRFGGAKTPQHRLTLTGHFTYWLPL